MKKWPARISIFISRSFWDYYLHPCQKTYALELAKRPDACVTWFDPPTRNPLTWFRERKCINAGVTVRRPFALRNEYERFRATDRFLFRAQLRSSLKEPEKADLWSIACSHSWLTKTKKPMFSKSIYWPGDFFQPQEEFPEYADYDLVMPWTPSGVTDVPEAYAGHVFRASTCPGESFLAFDTSAPLCPRFDFRDQFDKSIVYLGGLSTRRVDFKLLNALAKRFPRYALLLGAKPDGSSETDAALAELFACGNNVYLFDDLDYADLPALAQVADVCVIPYIVNDQTLGICPNKLFEYAALGKPVVSSPIPSLEQYAPPARIARNTNEFLTFVESFIANPPESEERSRLRILAETASPAATLQRMSETFAHKTKDEN